MITVEGRLLSRDRDICLNFGVALVLKIEPDITNKRYFLDPSFLLIQPGVLSILRLVLPDAELVRC